MECPDLAYEGPLSLHRMDFQRKSLTPLAARARHRRQWNLRSHHSSFMDSEEPRVVCEVGCPFQFLLSHSAIARALAPALRKDYFTTLAVVAVHDAGMREPSAARPQLSIVQVGARQDSRRVAGETLRVLRMEKVAFLA